jgi:hypothetical protein
LGTDPSTGGQTPRRGIALLALILGLVVSCATTPRAAQDEMPESRLPFGATAYGFAGIPQIKTALKDIYPELLADKNTAQFVDKTDYAVFGIYQDPKDGEKPASQSYFLITRGSYPASSYNFGLALSPKWKSVTINGKKWQQQGAIALSIGKTEAYIRVGRPPEQTNPLSSSDKELGAFFDGVRREAGAPKAFALYIPPSETAGLIRRLGIPFDITLQNITLSAFADPRAGTSYPSTLTLKTRSPSEAKALSAILSLARVTIGKRIPSGAENAFLTELLFAGPPALDDEGSTVIIKGAFPLDALVQTIKNR